MYHLSELISGVHYCHWWEMFSAQTPPENKKQTSSTRSIEEYNQLFILFTTEYPGQLYFLSQECGMSFCSRFSTSKSQRNIHLDKCFPGFNSCTLRLKKAEAQSNNHFHILWNCQVIMSYCQVIHKHINNICGVNIALRCDTVYMGDSPFKG